MIYPSDQLSIKGDQLNEENQVVHVLASLSELYILVAAYQARNHYQKVATWTNQT